MGHEEAKLRKIPDINNVTEDENGLYSLINVGSYRAAANLTARLLTNIGQGFGTANAEDVVQHTPYSLKLWFARFALLIRIGEYELLQKEAKAFHELRRIDMFYQVRIIHIQSLYIISHSTFLYYYIEYNSYIFIYSFS